MSESFYLETGKKENQYSLHTRRNDNIQREAFGLESDEISTRIQSRRGKESAITKNDTKAEQFHGSTRAHRIHSGAESSDLSKINNSETFSAGSGSILGRDINSKKQSTESQQQSASNSAHNDGNTVHREFHPLRGIISWFSKDEARLYKHADEKVGSAMKEMTPEEKKMVNDLTKQINRIKDDKESYQPKNGKKSDKVRHDKKCDELIKILTARRSQHVRKYSPEATEEEIDNYSKSGISRFFGGIFRGIKEKLFGKNKSESEQPAAPRNNQPELSDEEKEMYRKSRINADRHLKYNSLMKPKGKDYWSEGVKEEEFKKENPERRTSKTFMRDRLRRGRDVWNRGLDIPVINDENEDEITENENEAIENENNIVNENEKVNENENENE